MSETLFLEMPENFDFRQTVHSHGWCRLLPFELDDENLVLSYVFSDNQGGFYRASISEFKGKLKIETSEKTDAVVSRFSHILRFDDDLSDFYRIVKKEKRLKWIAEKTAGRMLRSPTVFEDLVKTICTTNCSWGFTKSMVRNLVEKLGNGGVAFPSAEQMASVSAEFYRDEIRAGYRSVYFAELAEKVASGKLNPEAWLKSDLPTKELKKEIKTVKGVGDYAAENLLKLLGRYDGLALDSFLRSEFYKKHNNGKICDDAKINDFYGKFGKWRGLVIWCDMDNF